MMLRPPLDFRNKIQTLEELVRRVPLRTAVLCHGVFDLVHPGHIRHLTYAKEKADYLVVSITADRHIAKAKYRPFVPEQLRALNLAALEMVDYVMIDPNPTPIETILQLRPKYFAKGFEYANGDPRTKEEIEAVQSYGGDMLFTPGDVVYSSSHLIERSPPDLKVDKLMLLLQAEGYDFDGLFRIMDAFRGRFVHVVGDTIVDSLSYTTLIGGMGKTPTPSVSLDERVDFVGGAAIVAKHLKAAGATVAFSTILGDDSMAQLVMDDLIDSGIEVNQIMDLSRPTTHKNAFVCGDYRMLKVDTVDNRSISRHQVELLVNGIQETEADAVVFSDFRHGIFNHNTIPPLVAAIRNNCFRVADSQVASRWGNILDFRGFDLITPNEKEARFALADQDATVRTLAAQLYEKIGCKTVILKLGDRGVLTCRGKEHDDPRTYFSVDSFAHRIVDAVGAGDALLAYATLSLLVDPSEVAASILGSMAAALECEYDGNVPIGCDDVRARIEEVRKLCGPSL